jgi:ABC-type uncharacterized transport system ATPase subunit
VILTGFGTQDSHLFPHQFLRQPGGQIFVAQGLFNYSTVRRPDGRPFADGSTTIPFNQCKLARFTPDGSSFETLTAGLSGGNQQKIALAKWLARDCDVLLIDEPTRGVDVGAKAEIYQLLDELACEGKALLVVSSELPELIGLCRRIIVLRAGHIAGEVARAAFSEATLMQLMAGVPAAA